MRIIQLIILAGLLLFSASSLRSQTPAFQFSQQGSILELRFSPDSSQLLSYSSGNQDLCLWDVTSGRLLWKRPISFIQRADEHYTLQAIAWNPDQNLIATASANGTVQLWNATNGDFLWISQVSDKEITALAFGPDGKTLVSSAMAGKNDSVKLLRVADGHIQRALAGDPCTGIAITFDATGEKLKIGNLDGNITEWNLGTARQLNAAPCREMRTYDWDTSFSQDLTVSVRHGGGQKVMIHDTRSGKSIRAQDNDATNVLSTVSEDGSKVVIRESAGFGYYDLATGKRRPVNDKFSVMSAFDLNNDGTLFAQEGGPYETSIIITEVGTGRVRYLDGHPSNVNGLTYSPDGKILAVAGNDRNIYFFEPTRRTLNRVLVGHQDRVTALAFTPDGRALLAGDASGNLRLWDVSAGKVIRELKAAERADKITSVEFNRSGTRFAVFANGLLSVWDAKTYKSLVTIHTAEGYHSTSGLMTFGYTSVPINDAVFNIEGDRLITGHVDGTIRIRDAATGTEVNKFKVAKGVRFVRVAPNGQVVLALVTDEQKNTLLSLDLATGNIVRASQAIDITYIERAGQSPNGRYVAIVGNVGDTEIWDLANLSRVRTLDYEYSGSDSVAFSPDSSTFFIGGENQNLFEYETATGKKLWQLLPDFAPGTAELALEAARDKRVAAINEVKANRNRQAALDQVSYRGKVYLTFEHYGDMSDPGKKKLVESDAVRESLVTKTAATANAVWVRLHNDSPLPVKVPTESMYLPNSKCFFLFPEGQKMLGLCPDREISVWFSVKDRGGKWLPYGFDFGSEAVLLPNSSVLFPIPLGVLRDDQTIAFSFSFQNVRASEADRDWDYGEKVELTFGQHDLPK